MTEIGFVPKEYLSERKMTLPEVMYIENIDTSNATPLSFDGINTLPNIVEHAGEEQRDGTFIYQPSNRFEINKNDLVALDEDNDSVESSSGNHGIVFFGQDKVLERPIAIKCIRPDVLRNSNTHMKDVWISMFYREARAIANTEHHNVAKIYGLVGIEHEGLTLPGMVLEKLNEKPEVMSSNEIMRMVREVSSALDYMHSQGIVHSDIKGSNIMCRESGEYVVTDFGSSFKKALDKNEYNTNHFTILYGDPQMQIDEAQSGELFERVDQYALALTVYGMLEQEMPIVNISHDIQQVTFPHPDYTPKAVMDVLKRATSYKREDRYESCTEFAKALEQAMAQPEKEQSVGKKLRSFTKLPARIFQKLIP